MSKESMGAFIDAVYAIAVTILALEVPGEIGNEFTTEYFWFMLLEYSIAFTLLFAFWLQHRRVNGLIETFDRISIWLTAGILLLVCLLPRATTLVFEYGEDVTLREIEKSLLPGGAWTLAELVDLFYVGLVLAIDFALLALVSISTRDRKNSISRAIRRSKITTTIIVTVMLVASLLMPVQNRYFLLFIPFALFFERDLLRLIFGVNEKPEY